MGCITCRRKYCQTFKSVVVASLESDFRGVRDAFEGLEINLWVPQRKDCRRQRGVCRDWREFEGSSSSLGYSVSVFYEVNGKNVSSPPGGGGRETQKVITARVFVLTHMM